jgi:hypothetical protein
MIKAENGKRAKSRARVALEKDKGKRIRDKPVFVTRDRAQGQPAYDDLPTIKFQAF